MSVFLNIMLGVLIFGYAAWTIYRFVRKAKKGKCASCNVNHCCEMAEKDEGC